MTNDLKNGFGFEIEVSYITPHDLNLLPSLKVDSDPVTR